MLFLSGVFGSFVVDYAIRQSVATQLTIFFVNQLPVPRLVEDDSGFNEIVKRAARLVCTTAEFDELAKAASLEPPSHKAGVADSLGRSVIRSQLDAMVAHLYGLSEDEFAHILATFPLVPEVVRRATLDEFVRMRDTGEAAIFNPDLAKPVAAAVDPAKAVRDLIAAGESATVEFTERCAKIFT